MRIFLKTSFFLILLCALAAVSFFVWVQTLQADDEIVWGVDFSEDQARHLGLDSTETYSAIINDLGVKHIKIHINWNSIEKEQGMYDFSLLDSQVQEAKENDVQLILVIGMKTGRWPECHAPEWFNHVPEDKRQEEIISYITQIVERYKNNTAILYWQVENEPLLEFGKCPQWYYQSDTTLLQAEVDAVRLLDPSRKIIISDSGELSTWTQAATIGDIVGVTMYRSSWNATQKTFGINPYTFLSPEFYSTKAAFIRSYYQKPVIGVELQAEPWASKSLPEASLAEQEKSMNLVLFKENIEFAKQAGLHTYYFWGAEWWYWMKIKHNRPEIWSEAKALFVESN